MGVSRLLQDRPTEALEYALADTQSGAFLTHIVASASFLKLNDTENAQRQIDISRPGLSSATRRYQPLYKGLSHAIQGLIYQREGRMYDAQQELKAAKAFHPRSVDMALEFTS